MSNYIKPDKVEIKNGVVLFTKYIPVTGIKILTDTYKPTKPLVGNKAQWVTIHNTNPVKHNENTTDAEQYVRATINGNMGSISHIYVDDSCAWLIVPKTIKAWHSGDTFGNPNGGNNTSIAYECIMNGEDNFKNKKAYDNLCRLVAGDLLELNLSTFNLMSHYAWTKKNKALNPDKKVSIKKCPQYILGKWDVFKTDVQKYIDIFKV